METGLGCSLIVVNVRHSARGDLCFLRCNNEPHSQIIPEERVSLIKGRDEIKILFSYNRCLYWSLEKALASIREVFIGALDVALEASAQIIPDIQGGKKRPIVPSRHTMMNIHRKIRSITIATYFQSSLTCPKANTQCGSKAVRAGNL